MEEFMTAEEWKFCVATEYCLSQGYPVSDEDINKRIAIHEVAFQKYYEAYPNNR